MHLAGGDQPVRRRAQRRGGAGPVGGDPLRVVAAAQADVERSPDALADAALAAEEAVPHAGHCASASDSQHHRRFSPASNPGGTGAPGAVSASDLEQLAHGVGGRSAARSRSVSAPRCSGVARSSSARSRSSMPEPPQELALTERAVDRGTGAERARAARARKSTWAERSASPGATSGSARGVAADGLEGVAGHHGASLP